MNPTPRTLLIVEDDPAIRDALVEAIESDGHAVVACETGPAGLEAFASSRPDLILLDLMLPGLNGYDVCRQIREADKQVPIIMLTAKGEEIDKVLGLELGADDYVTKPFGVRELLARVHAALRRLDHLGPPTEPAEHEEFRFGEAVIDGRQYVARIAGREAPLSAREMQLLQFFHKHPGEVLSRDRLLNAVWGVDYFGTTRTLDQHVAQLRKKVAPEHGLRLIRTVHGVGYKYMP